MKKIFFTLSLLVFGITAFAVQQLHIGELIEKSKVTTEKVSNIEVVSDINDIILKCSGALKINKIDSLKTIIVCNPGNYTLQAGADNPVFKNIHIRDGFDYKLMISKGTTVYSKIQIITDPPDAEIYFDGNYSGTTPAYMTVSEAGHLLSIVKPEFLEVNKVIQTDAQKKFFFKLKPDHAILRVNTSVDSAQVFLNSKLLGYAPMQVKIPLEQAAVKIKKQHYHDHLEVVNPAPGDKINVDAELTMNSSWVKIECKPQAKLYVDDIFVGETPFKGYISNGSRNFILYRDKYHTLEFNYDVHGKLVKKFKLKRKGLF